MRLSYLLVFICAISFATEQCPLVGRSQPLVRRAVFSRAGISTSMAEIVRLAVLPDEASGSLDFSAAYAESDQLQLVGHLRNRHGVLITERGLFGFSNINLNGIDIALVSPAWYRGIEDLGVDYYDFAHSMYFSYEGNYLLLMPAREDNVPRRLHILRIDSGLPVFEAELGKGPVDGRILADRAKVLMALDGKWMQPGKARFYSLEEILGSGVSWD